MLWVLIDMRRVATPGWGEFQQRIQTRNQLKPCQQNLTPNNTKEICQKRATHPLQTAVVATTTNPPAAAAAAAAAPAAAAAAAAAAPAAPAISYSL